MITSEKIEAILRECIKVDATGLSPAVAPAYIVGIEEAAREISALALLPGEPVGYTSQENIDALRKNPTWRGAMWAKPLGEGFDVSIPLYASPAPQPVAVKALEWGPYRAETPFGYYHIDDQTDRTAEELKGRAPFLLSGTRLELSRHPSLIAARSAAQADYESRIRSALILNEKGE